VEPGIVGGQLECAILYIYIYILFFGDREIERAERETKRNDREERTKMRGDERHGSLRGKS
jgi:hypothetical protein